MKAGLMVLLVSGVLSLVGCSQTASQHANISPTVSREEAIIKSTNNPQGLVDYLKAQLANHDTPENRYKLADAYLAINDHESALFYLSPIAAKKSLSAEGYYLLGRAKASKGDYLQARYALIEAIVLAPTMAQAFNFLGVIDADHGRYEDARKSFNEARRLLHDDVVIKNNLAVLAIYEENYQEAFERLLPLWSNSKGDGQVRANLMLAMAKLGHFDDFRLLADSGLDQFEVIELYQALASSKPRGSSYD